MRGHLHCRSHLDPILGPRGAGAPPGNINAYKTGRYISPLSPIQIKRLAHDIAQDPDNFEQHLTNLVHDLWARVGSDKTIPPALKALLALNGITTHLIPHLANELFITELNQLLQQFPPADRADLQSTLWRILLTVPGPQRITVLRKFKSNLDKNDPHREQLPR